MVKEISSDFLLETSEDYVGLWSLIWRIRNRVNGIDSTVVRTQAISILTELLQSGAIKAGIPNLAGEFEEWRGSPKDVIARIEDEWDQLGREPDIGDIVWFTATDHDA